MWILVSAYCRVTGEKITAHDIYHLPGDRAGVPDSYCRCHDEKVIKDGKYDFIKPGRLLVKDAGAEDDDGIDN